MNPSALVDLALIGATGAAANCDPALDLAAPNAGALLSAYERSRSDADRAALPLRPDMRLALFRVRPLTSAALRVVMAEVGTKRLQTAFVVACHEYTDGKGQTHKAADHGGLATHGKVVFADDEWLDFLTLELGLGSKAIAEVGAFAIQRAEAGAAATAPFGLPLGLMLPR